MIDLEVLPHLPGCYLFKNKDGTVLYVGKAKDLKKRVSSYFQKRYHEPKTESLVKAAKDLDFIVTNTEVEAFLLENTLIKKHWPRYNIALKDSKRYACIHLTDEKFPRIRIARKKADGGSFFGPFVSAKERDYIFEVVRKTFQLRTCKQMPKRACLRYHIAVCSGPCIGAVSIEDYDEKVKKAASVLKGNIKELIESMEKDMRETLSSPLPRIHIIIGVGLSAMTKSFIQVAVILGFGLLLGVRFFEGYTATQIFVSLIGIMFFIGAFSLGFLFLSTAIAITMESPEGMQAVITLLTMPFFFTSNALYPASSFPPVLRVLSTINPLTHLVNGIRYFAIGSDFSSIGIRYTYTQGEIIFSFLSLLAFAAIMFLIARWRFTKVTVT